MILTRYAGRILIRFAILMALLLLLISFLKQISVIAPKQFDGSGNPLGTIDKLFIALGKSSYDALDFMPIIFMLSCILTLITLGRRAELHVIRGIGLSGGRILITLGMVAALAMISVMLILRPLTFEARQWAEDRENPSNNLENIQSSEGRIAWISAENGGIQGRLEGFKPEQEKALRVTLVDSSSVSLDRSFLFGSHISVNENKLQGEFQTAQGEMININIALDNSPSILSPNRPNFFLPLPHLMGWVDNQDRWALSERQTRYLIMRALAEPFLTAALVLLAGTLCIEVGTRQPLARLIFGVLGFVIITYSVYVVAHAFGLNGKLPPLMAAWAMPLALGFSGLAFLAFRDLTWHFDPRLFQRKSQ